MTDEFAVVSEPDQGTTVTMTKRRQGGLAMDRDSTVGNECRHPCDP